jgi:tetratricopeptide (TPR) repeat protein
VQRFASMVRRGVVVAAMVTGMAFPRPAEAQLARQTSNERILVLTPVSANPADTGYVATLADALRDRMASKYRFRMFVIPTEKICEALEASGFNCQTPQPPENAAPLAKFLQATGYIVGWLDHANDSLVLTLRLVNTAGSGLGGWARFAVPANTAAGDFGRTVAEGLDTQIKAAEYARECTQRRERGDQKGAAERAQRAFELYPNQPAAALCLALVHEVRQDPLDSIVAALRKAVVGDSLDGRAWESLGRRLQDMGDTTAALNAFRNQLRAEPANGQLRLGLAAAYVARKDYEPAVEILDEGLAVNPGDLPMLALKERACLEGTMWRCGLQALDQEYQIDTAFRSDSVFYQKVFGAAQSIPDTAAMVKWSALAVERFPNSVALWRARAAALKVANERNQALQAYQRLLALDSTQVGSALAAAQLLLDSTLVIDTSVPLDTARLNQADRLLQLVAQQARDTVTLMNVAALYYNPAAKISQLRMMPYLPLAARFLEHALQYDVRGSLTGPANFFLGLAYFFQVTELDTKVRQTKDCNLVDVEIDMTQKAKRALTIGRSISPQTVDQLLGFVRQLETALPTYKPAFRCK